MISTFFSKKSAVIFSAAVSFVIPAASVWAQAVEEIIVTTRYEKESIQDVPIAVTAIGSDAIERRGITDLFKIAEIDPSVSFDTSYGPGDTRVAIRGLSNTRGRSNVAFLVDGVDVTSENQIAAGSGMLVNQRLLTDVERIEIVKGPQNALYGRAAFAGAISYTTKDPTDTLEGGIGFDAAQGNEYQLKGNVSGPISDTLGFRLDGVAWTSDGRFTNSVSGADLGGSEGWASSAKLLWEPVESFDVRARVSYSTEEATPRPTAVPLYDTFYAYPQEALDNGIGLGKPFGNPAIGGRTLGVANHGTYCPDLGVWNDGNPLDPDFGNTLPGVAPGTPGLCLPGNLGSVSDLPNGKNSIAHSETMYGEEQPGSTLDLFRTSVTANWDTEAGLFTFIGGYTDAGQTDMHDQDFQAFGRPDRIGTNDPFIDYGGTKSVGQLQTDSETDTRQLSGEFRFSTQFEGPVNATVGYLRWDQKVSTLDRNFIASCMKTVADFTPGSENVFTGEPTISDNTIDGMCDGLPALALIEGQFISGNTLDTWQQYIQQFVVNENTVGIDPRVSLVPGRIPGTPWVSDTDHQSIYMQVGWEITDSLELETEARWVDEDFTMSRSNQASCANIAVGYGRPASNSVLGGPWLDESTGNVPDLNCSSVTGIGTFNDWQIIKGTVSDDFIVPKATLRWFIDDSRMMYLSWAKAQKPGGINQLEAGGSAVTIETLSFEAEKMTTWELGAKTSWEVAGTLRANGALFYNDYTDKQVSTQVLDEFGTLQPRVANASAAEVFGVEVDLTWLPSAVDGLSLRAAYTYQDATYSDYIENTTSAPRAAMYGGCPIVDVNPDPDVDELFCALDLSGNQLERQAPNAFSGNFSYVRPLPGNGATEWFVEGDASYTDKRFIDQDNAAYFDEYWLVNFRVGLQDDKWDVVVFMDNAFDDDTFRTGGSGPDFALQNTRLGFTAGLGANGFFGIMPNPRTIGLRTNYRFGG